MNQENNFDGQDNNGVPNNQPLQNKADIKTTNVNETQLNNTSAKKSNIVLIIGIIIVIALIVGATIFAITSNKNKSSNRINSEIKKSAYWISGNSLEAFDLYFLQLENEKQNKVYSPLSIKYALEMLEEGTNGESKTQISSIIGNYKAKNYTNSKNMSFANAIFIKDTYENSVKENYTNTLISKYNAGVKTDSFATPNIVNSWISDKTLGLINNLFDDISQEEFLLINALAIDMEWEQKFILNPGVGVLASYAHENFSWAGDRDIVSQSFKDNNEKVSGMEIIASFNNYDIVNVLGEENIRQTVKNAYIEYLKNYPNEKFGYDLYISEDTTGLSDDEIMEKYLDDYIKEINSNYKAEDKTTDFSLYVDDKVKVFAKDLKEYDGTTLQYVGIMPTTEKLDSYINKVTADELNNIIENLKELKSENFKDGVVTKITGFIPKFKFEYKLDLIEDLKKLGVTNVFESGKANLTNISSDETLYINDATHKANIEFTQEGIKAAAATVLGGAGAGVGFDYIYDVPIEEIDLTFDKPYMFIIRDKNSGEVWFVGTVYNPLLYSKDTTKGDY